MERDPWGLRWRRVGERVGPAWDIALCAVMFAALAAWGVARELRGQRADYWFPGRGARRA
jgi:hypothetical protein